MVKRWLAAVFILAVVGAASSLCTYRIARAAPPLHVSISAPQSIIPVAGTPPPIPLPATGSFDITTDRDGTLASQDAQTPHPTASIAKTMTALVLLDAKPLAVDADGPTLTASAADVDLLAQIIANGGTSAPVEAGEVLTERDLLEGMMLPSANNYAIMVGRWVTGSDATFVDRLNAKAVALGMTHTHFADPDGLSADTTSTASDLILLGKAAIANPTLMKITSLASATLPDGAVITNVDTEIGSQPGWIGVKTGHTDPAGYCLLFAVRHTFATDAQPVTITVVGVVLGQPSRELTFSSAEAAIAAAYAGYVTIDTSTLMPSVIGAVTSDWGASAAASAGTPPSEASPPRYPIAVVRKGQTATVRLKPMQVAVPLAAGAEVATVTVDGGSFMATWPVLTSTPLSGPNFWWRLAHN